MKADKPKPSVHRFVMLGVGLLLILIARVLPAGIGTSIAIRTAIAVLTWARLLELSHE